MSVPAVGFTQVEFNTIVEALRAMYHYDLMMAASLTDVDASVERSATILGILSKLGEAIEPQEGDGFNDSLNAIDG